MTPRLITTTALLAALTLGVFPVAAFAHDRDDGGDDDGEGYSEGVRGYPENYRGRDGDTGQYEGQGNYGRRYSYNSQVYVQQGYGGGYGNGYDGGYGNSYNGGYNGGYGGGYYQQRPAAYGYNGYGQGYRNRCRNNNTGTIIGAIAGGLIGNGVAGRGDRLLGAVIGGGAGALVGNGIDRNSRRC